MLRFHPCTNAPDKERGWLLASSAVLILVIVAMVASFAFVMKRSSHFQGNYATGERLADLAVMAHSYAQNEVYTKGNGIDSIDLYGGLSLPDNFAFAPVENTDFSAEVIGWKDSPIDATELQAASAYVHLRIRPFGGGRAPSDNAALLAGASHHGMSRVGFYKLGIDPADVTSCSGSAPAVRWGSEDTGCLTDSQIATLGFNDLQPGDIIVPAWETALALLNGDAVLRFPQPQRSTSNIMSTDINMESPDESTCVNTKCKIKNANIVNADKLNPSRTPSGIATIKDLVVTQDTRFTGFVEKVADPANKGLQVSNASGALTMDVDGDVDFTSSNLMIGGTLTGSKGNADEHFNLNANSDNDVAVDSIGQDGDTIVVKPGPAGTLDAGVRLITAPLQNLTVNNGSRLAVAGDVNTPIIQKFDTKLDMYAAEMNTDPNTETKVNQGAGVDPGTWNVKSISQIGDDDQHELTIDHVVVTDCFSSATPSACPPPQAPGPPL